MERWRAATVANEQTSFTIQYMVSCAPATISENRNRERKVNVLWRYDFIFYIWEEKNKHCCVLTPHDCLYELALSILGKRISVTQLRSPTPMRDWILFCQTLNYHYLLLKNRGINATLLHFLTVSPTHFPFAQFHTCGKLLNRKILNGLH